jgi:hypothetical protein
VSEDAAVDAGVDCDDDCVGGWWTVVTGGCSALCSLTPQPRECAQSDCEQFEAHKFSEGDAHFFVWMTHSPGQQTFTAILLREDTWALPAPCKIRIGDGAQPSDFTCVGDEEMRFATATYLRPTGELQIALETALQAGQCEHTY